MTAKTAQPVATDTAFELEDVSYHYPGGAAALRNVSLSVQRGEQMAILGANGSGKSTLLKILNGLLSPSSGRVRAFGEEINERTLRDEGAARRFRARVGFVFQNPDAQLFCSTVRGEIAFGPLQMELGEEDVLQRIEDVARMLNIRHLLDRAPYHLSGGEKKRVAIASVLVMNPDALLLDEPTAGLDPRSQSWLVDTLWALAEAGKTIVLSTHHLELVPHLARRAVVLGEDHTLQAEGTVPQILQDEALLLRTNLLHAHFHRHGDAAHTHVHYHAGEHEHEH
ncbi:MAG: energy-coupling factor ABC transporter ATP-binding protein [Chthonomonadales bacterium]